jgi:hypothetical protein
MYMQMNTSSEANSERLTTLEREVRGMRTEIQEEQFTSLALKHMYQTRLDSNMALQKPLNAIRRELALAGFKEHELKRDLLIKTNALRHVLKSVSKADTRYEEQQHAHTMRLSVQLDCLRERNIVKGFVAKLEEQDLMRARLREGNLELKRLYESAANAEDEEAIEEELTQHEAYINRQERLLKKLQQTVHVVSAEDMLYKLEHLKENKSSLEELSSKLIEETNKAHEELTQLKRHQNLVRLQGSDSDQVNIKQFETQVNKKQSKMKAKMEQKKETDRTVLTALGVLGRIYSDVVGRIHTTTSKSLDADCNEIAELLVEMQRHTK